MQLAIHCQIRTSVNKPRVIIHSRRFEDQTSGYQIFGIWRVSQRLFSQTFRAKNLVPNLFGRSTFYFFWRAIVLKFGAFRGRRRRWGVERIRRRPRWSRRGPRCPLKWCSCWQSQSIWRPPLRWVGRTVPWRETIGIDIFPNGHSAGRDPIIFVLIALQYAWRLKFRNPNRKTNDIGGATCLSLSNLCIFFTGK